MTTGNLRPSAALVAVALLLAACTTAPRIKVAGGSGIEGTGLNDTKPRSPLATALGTSGPTVKVLALDGVAVAGRRLKAGDQFSVANTFELRSGTAQLLLGEAAFTVVGPARVQVALVDGTQSMLVEAGQLASASGGRVATPNIASLACEGGFSVQRSGTTTLFDCARGAARWRGADTPFALERPARGEAPDASIVRWELDEARQQLQRR